MKENKNKITVDELLTKIPNKYELVIVCGKHAKEKFLEGVVKHKIMPSVFEDIMEDKLVIKKN